MPVISLNKPDLTRESLSTQTLTFLDRRLASNSHIFYAAFYKTTHIPLSSRRKRKKGRERPLRTCEKRIVRDTLRGNHEMDTTSSPVTLQLGVHLSEWKWDSHLFTLSWDLGMMLGKVEEEEDFRTDVWSRSISREREWEIENVYFFWFASSASLANVANLCVGTLSRDEDRKLARGEIKLAL